MSPSQKTFRPYNPEQLLLLPPNLSEWVPEGHLARLVSELVDEVLDLSDIYAAYSEERGAPPYEPRLLTKLLLYGYATGIFSSRRLERAAQELVPVRYLSCDQQPDHWTISEFRRRHLAALQALFVQVLDLCQEAGLVQLGHVALDGTKMKANASKHKAVSYGRVRERQTVYRREVQRWLTQAETTDRVEDRRYGRHRGDELPKELQHAQTRLARLRKAKAELEKRAKAEGRAAPADGAQYNFTDPESRIMVNGEKTYVQGYNCQAAVDDTPHHIVVAGMVTNQAADNPHLVPMVEAVVANTGRRPKRLSADAGYGAAANLTALAARGIDAYIAQRKEPHGNRPESPPRGRIPAALGIGPRMARKLRTKTGHAVYKRRKHVAEPPFGIIKQAMGFRQFHLRGLTKVRGEWGLLLTAYNLGRLHASGRLQPGLEP